MQEKLLAGIDFGTSNSLLSVATKIKEIKPVPIYNDKAVIPTTLFFWENGSFYGEKAVQSYLKGEEGRFMRGIKSLLNSQTEREGTRIFGRFYSFKNIIKTFLNHLKTEAEARLDAPIEDVVLGRPVHFCDNEKEDKAAEECLKKIALELGFKNVSFQYEPVAAAFSHEQEIQKEELALIADLGGGTSDFSVIRLVPNALKKQDRSQDILSNDSVHLAGTDLDRDTAYTLLMPHFGKNSLRKNGLAIPYVYFNDVCEWHKIQSLYTPNMQENCLQLLQDLSNKELFQRYVSMIQKELGHYMLFETEKAKIDLSSSPKTTLNFTPIEKDFMIFLSKEEFLSATLKTRDKIIQKAKETILNAGISPEKINSLIFTGGTSLVPSLSKGIKDLCPNAVVQNISTYASVGNGLAIEAYRRYGK